MHITGSTLRGTSKRWHSIKLSYYHERPPKIRRKRSKAGNRELGDLGDDIRFGDLENELYDVTDNSDNERSASTAQNITPMAPNMAESEAGGGAMATPVPNTERDVSPASSEPAGTEGGEEEEEGGEEKGDKEEDDEDAIQSGADALLGVLA
ncbi:hypothetical protein P167DRAFT_604073 [Morchella conica CCBAS932]|uniref:Uncharacterized protein n=1 Tax=Morchella conica CCBAS932 TaxID=1392247 RepID=A0A3N4KYZ9_9PEZI|nr:hypothetical protein P167DRAFT_604073 [Morchella conica CCBAS932]